MVFGRRLRDLREDNDISPDEFADILHISKRALNYYENNLREPSYPLLIKIADYFDVSIDYLLGRTDKMDPFHKLK